MLNKQENNVQLNQSAFKIEEQKKNINKQNNAPKGPENLNKVDVQDNIIKLKNFDEGEEEVNADNLQKNKIIDINQYKQQNSLIEADKEEELEENINEKKSLQPQFKSKLSAGAEGIELGDIEETDSRRMQAVKTALENYYKLRDKPIEEDDEDDEESKQQKENEKRVAITTSLQNIVSTCNKYIANRWPMSKKGRQRLRDVKDLRKNAIKELGDQAGHPGWALAGEYFKFGLKAVSAPVWVPALGVAKAVKHTGIWAGRVGKRVGRIIKRKAVRFADRVSLSFHSWKAFGATLLAGVLALLWGTIANVINTVITAVCLPFWLLGSMVTVPRYLYHRAKGHVKLDATDLSASGKYRCMAFSMPTPHLYSTWFKFFLSSDFISKHINDYGYNHKHQSKEPAKTGVNARNNIEYIYNDAADANNVADREGENWQYHRGILGPRRDVYYHSTALAFKKLAALFRYSDKNDYDKVADRSKEEYNIFLHQNEEGDYESDDGDEN